MKRILITAIASLVALIASVSAVGAAQNSNVFVVHRVAEADGVAEVRFQTHAHEADIKGISFKQNGQDLEVKSVKSVPSDTPRQVAIVLDSSSRGNAHLDTVKSTIQEVVAGNDWENVELSIWSAGESIRSSSVTDPTVQNAISFLEGIGTSSEAKLTDAILRAADNMGASSGAVKSVVVVAFGEDVGSQSTGLVSVLGNQVQVYSVQVGPSPQVSDFVAKSNGFTMLANADANSIATEVRNGLRYAIDRSVAEVDTASLITGANLEITLNGYTVRSAISQGQTLSGADQLSPYSSPSESMLARIINGPLAIPLVVVMCLIIAAGAYFLITSIVDQRSNSIDGVLSTYIKSGTDGGRGVKTQAEAIMTSSVVQKVVSATETFAQEKGFSERLSHKLERANLPVRPGEALFFAFMGTLATMVGGFLFTRSVLATVMIGLACVVVMTTTLGWLVRRRLRQFERQLPDTLQLLAGTLRAGYSLPQGLDAVSKEIADPMGTELLRAVSEIQLGRSFDEALGEIAERLDSPDFAWTVMAIAIQREVGGNLNELLDTVAETITQRERLRGEVKALTAEGRISAFILVVMPPGIGLIISIMNPDYLDPLFTTLIGWGMLAGGIVAGLVGLFWMKKVISIDG